MLTIITSVTLESCVPYSEFTSLRPPCPLSHPRRVMWCMMCEALPPNVTWPDYDPGLFACPFGLLPPRLQVGQAASSTFCHLGSLKSPFASSCTHP